MKMIIINNANKYSSFLMKELMANDATFLGIGNVVYVVDNKNNEGLKAFIESQIENGDAIKIKGKIRLITEYRIL